MDVSFNEYNIDKITYLYIVNSCIDSKVVYVSVM